VWVRCIFALGDEIMRFVTNEELEKSELGGNEMISGMTHSVRIRDGSLEIHGDAFENEGYAFCINHILGLLRTSELFADGLHPFNTPLE
jgi:hypothetical protein